MAPLGNNRNGTFSESELRAVERSVFGGRRVLWAGVLAVLLPLLVLLGLQYWWLADLERNSAIAREAKQLIRSGETVFIDAGSTCAALARAIRADKMALAALTATLGHYLRGEALSTVPVWRMICS